MLDDTPLPLITPASQPNNRSTSQESATPGLNWALGLDALRVLEAAPSAHTLDWLVSIDADEEEDMRERIECGVQGEAFRRDRRQSTMSITRIDAGAPGVALALPESCRVAVDMAGALPEGAEVLWRVTPSSGRPPDQFERCLGGGSTTRPFWVTASSAADARMLSRSLPPRCVWAAHLTRRERAPQFFTAEGVNDRTPPPPPLHLPTANELQMLRDAGCQGLALELWGGEKDRVEAAEAEARTAQQLVEWADAANLAVVVDQGR